MIDGYNFVNSLPEPEEEIVSITGSLGSGSGGTATSSGGGYTITIPTTGAGCAGGNITWVPGGYYNITIGGSGGGGGQISLPDIDLAVPVEKKKKDSDGCTCRKCKEFFPYAEPNQDDGTLICYGCRMVW